MEYCVSALRKKYNQNRSLENIPIDGFGLILFSTYSSFLYKTKKS